MDCLLLMKHLDQGNGLHINELEEIQPRATMMLTFHLSNQVLQMVMFQFENQNSVKPKLLRQENTFQNGNLIK